MKYFYHLHHFRGEIPRDILWSGVGVMSSKVIKDYLHSPSRLGAHGVHLVNEHNDYIEREREDYIINFNNDIRRYTDCGVKELDFEGYVRVCKMEDEIIRNLTDKQVSLLNRFNIIPWHRPFKEDKNGNREYYQVIY